MKSYEKEYRHCLENSNKMELVDKIIYDEKEIERLNKENKLLQDMDKILRNENTNLKLEIERLNNILVEIKEIINNKYWFNWEYENDEVIKEVLEIISKEEGKNEN